jgi:hypothetical protein
MYPKLIFHCSNINTNSLVSSNYIKLEKQQLQNLRFPQQNIPGDQHPESGH